MTGGKRKIDAKTDFYAAWESPLGFRKYFQTRDKKFFPEVSTRKTVLLKKMFPVEICQVKSSEIRLK